MKLRIKLLRIGLALFGLLLVFIIGAVGWRAISIRSAQQAYDKRLAEIKAKGQVVDLAGIERLHTERASKELVEPWNALFEDLSKPEFIEASQTLPYLGSEGLAAAQVPIRGQAWEEEAKARKFLVDCTQLRDKLRKLAVKGSAVYFPIETSGESFGDCQAHFSARRAMKLLMLDGQMALRYNATAVAIDDIRALLGLSRLFRGEPSLIGLLIDNGTERAALEIVQSAVEQRALSESQLKELIVTLQAVKIPQEHLWLAAEGERGSLIATLDDMGKRLGVGRYLLGSPRGRLAALDLIDHIQAVKFDNLDEAMQAIDNVERESNKYVAGMGWVTSADHIAPMKLVGLFAAGASLVEQQMQLRLAELALTIQLYRAQQGRLPGALSDLSSMGADLQRLMPIGGKPFGYRLSDDKSTAELWGFHILLRDLKTPDEPLPIEGQDSNNGRWLWKL